MNRSNQSGAVQRQIDDGIEADDPHDRATRPSSAVVGQVSMNESWEEAS